MTDTPPPQTRVIGRYSILRELRRERHSVSYAAVDPVMNRQLVLKAVELLPAGSKITTEERKRVEQAFVRQAQAAGRLQHPNIVTVFDAGLSAAFGFLVIERVNGRPLHELIAGGLRPEYVQAASIAARIADAIECAHANGVAHGHLGPQHVYLQGDGSPKVSGFGGWIDDGSGGDEALAGTARLLPYFQNEVSEEARRADLKAVGQLLYMMLVGRAAPPTPAPAEGEPAPITRAARPETPAALARLVDQALLAGQVEGLKSAGALRDALTAFIWNERAENVSPSLLGLPLAPPPSRAPVHVATLTPEEQVAPAAPEPRAGAPRAAGTRPGAATLAVAAGQGAAGRGPGSGATAADAAAPRNWIEAIKPWAIRYRVALVSVGGFLLVSILIGVLLGNLRRAPAAAAPAAAAIAAPAAEAPAAERVAATLPKTPVTLDVRPWGEVIVDAKPIGVSPPLTSVDLAPGRHHIEVRHDPAPPWSTDIDVQGTAPMRVEHGFE
jgi:serine/threonine-protein kinase